MLIICAFLTSISFALLFNMPKRLIVYAGICGVVGQIGYSAADYFQCSEAICLFFAAVALTISSEVEARICKCPSTLFMICSLIPFVPGKGLYYTVVNLILKNREVALQYGLDTLAGIIAIVMGCSIISGIVQGILRYKKRIQQA